MATRRKVLDAVIRHRIDLQRYAKGEASSIVRLLASNDAKIVEQLRFILPSTPGARASIDRLVEQVTATRGRQLGEVRARLHSDLVQLAESEGATIGKLMSRAVGVPVAFNPIQKLASRQSVSRAFGGAPGSRRTLGRWFNDLARADQRRLSTTIRQGLYAGQTHEQIVRTLVGTPSAKYADGVMAITRREAETAVRTASNHVANAAQVSWAKANSDVVTGMEWLSLLDERTCPICESLHGEITQGDPAPPAHPNCRCTLVPILDLDALAEAAP
jgi:SPP1 gp7 family putative phage head morphogenesis protein